MWGATHFLCHGPVWQRLATEVLAFSIDRAPIIQKWTATNRLLAIEGYDGVKTGTTSAAGACLVSKSRRGGRALILIVLGSRSSEARYTDTRNLYRWAWQALAHGQQDGK